MLTPDQKLARLAELCRKRRVIDAEIDRIVLEDPDLPVPTPRKGRAYSSPEVSEMNKAKIRALHAEGKSDSEIAACMPEFKRSTVKSMRQDLGLPPNSKKFPGHECCGAKGQRHKRSCVVMHPGGQPLPADLKTMDAVDLLTPIVDDVIDVLDQTIRGQMGRVSEGTSWRCIECGLISWSQSDEKPERCKHCMKTVLVQVL